MTAPWAVVASASDFDPDRRASIATEMRDWLRAGGNGVALITCHRAELASRATGVAVALGGPWSELELVAGSNLPPIADISAPQAVPDSVRRRMNGSFLGIDDLYRRGGPFPGAYIEDAERLVALKAAEFIAWLERKH